MRERLSQVPQSLERAEAREQPLSLAPVQAAPGQAVAVAMVQQWSAARGLELVPAALGQAVVLAMAQQWSD